MANKFQKSVLERLEQESIRQKSTKRESVKDVAVSTADFDGPAEQSISAVQDRPVRIKAVSEGSEHSAVEGLSMDINDFLRPVPQRLAKNKTFYLDGDVIAAVKKTAKAKSVTDSRLVNDILRRVLGL